MIDERKLKIILAEYKKKFPKLFWTDKENNEKYKWIAVKHFQDHWNINDPNFYDMFNEATSKTENLLAAMNYFPKGMILEFCKVAPEDVRNMFRELYDESISVVTRVENFIKESEHLRTKYQPKSGWNSHYQNTNSITTYLWLKYPDKYYIYKYSECKAVADEINSDYKPKKGAKPESLLNAISLYDEIADKIADDSELVELFKNTIDETCYSDPKFRTLAIDVGFFISRHYNQGTTETETQSTEKVSSELGKVIDDTYWPSLEEYNPNISSDEWVAFLQKDRKSYPSTLEMLKAMLELGGEATCKRIAELIGEHPSSCVSRGNTLGRRVKRQYNLPPCMDEGKERYFPVAFVGRRVIENGQQLYAWKLRPELKAALESMNLGEVKSNEETTDVNKNTILYGPPGTGKTYNTVVYAVAIIENKKLQSVKDEDYDDVLARYNKYKSDGLIEFTTFHQSYGYEEFIEGIKPIIENSDDGQNDIEYQISSGLFKNFCDKANRPVFKQKKQDIRLNNSPTIWKVSLEGTGDNPTRKECMENGHIRIGWDNYGENISSDTNFDEGGKNVLNAFIYKMKIGDVVLSCYSATTIDAIGIVTGDYEWHDEYPHYKRLRKVDWIAKGINADIVEMNNGSTLTLSSVYKLNVSLTDVMDIVTRKATTTEIEEKKKNYVFVIDEINRGNISKIFGELITLIEPTKRVGQPEGMKLKLPYSQKPFGVPDNVYLIGTMNTADRSIATIDTALRRRFRFKEMLPDADVLDGIFVDDISIKDMLIKMNKRIAVLYDREHTLGHAYFLPLKTKPTVETLSGIFADCIIPLLQEYFYEDYEKIRLVLGDNNKLNQEDQFIVAVPSNYNELFGNTDYGFDEANTYEINAEAFENIEAYRSI